MERCASHTHTSYVRRRRMDGWLRYHYASDDVPIPLLKLEPRNLKLKLDL
jgi:hypothetical protein